MGRLESRHLVVVAALVVAVTSCATAPPPSADSTDPVASPADGDPSPAPASPDDQAASYVVAPTGATTPLSFTDNGDGTVTDDVTGLMWQAGFTQLAWDDAAAAATGADTGGYDDWRVPTIDELWSLIDLSGDQGTGDPAATAVPADAVPFIDTDVFDFEYPTDPTDPTDGLRYIDAQYVSSTVYVGTVFGGQEAFFGVNFADGRIKGYPITGPSTRASWYARFVRGDTDYGDNAFRIDGDTVVDDATGLRWTRADSGAEAFAADVSDTTRGDGSLDWEEALDFCDALDVAGRTDWRLPDAKQLQDIVDYQRAPDVTGSAAIADVFDVTGITNEAGDGDFPAFWSATSFNPGSEAYVVFFGRALGLVAVGDGAEQYLDVHGAGTVRTDPKSGEPTAGSGPQGDVRRVYNHVRCVTDR